MESLVSVTSERENYVGRGNMISFSAAGITSAAGKRLRGRVRLCGFMYTALNHGPHSLPAHHRLCPRFAIPSGEVDAALGLR